MHAVESAAFASGRVSARSLMERAGKSAADLIHREFCADRSLMRRAMVLCGPGNNGGDGFRIAECLHTSGWKVVVWAVGDPARMSSAAKEMRGRFGKLGEIKALDTLPESDPAEPAVYVDALFGIGLARPLRGTAAKALGTAMSRGPLAAVDILSGLHADSGEFSASEIPDPSPAHMTVTFECAKPGHFIGAGGRLSGQLSIVPLGLEQERGSHVPPAQRVRLWTAGRVPASLLSKREEQHKYEHGHVLVVAGPVSRGGAARLAARAALRIGAGLVTVGAPSSALAEHAAQLNAVMLTEIGNAERLKQVLQDPRINAVCIGPGLGRNALARELVLAVLDSDRKSVLDADALTAFADNPGLLLGRVGGRTVLTPHAGEFARLFGGMTGSGGGSGPSQRIDAVREAALSSRVTVLLKGACTIIAAPDGEVSLVAATGANAVPWLATAGSGDVLAGLITGLLARGADSDMAAGIGAWLLNAAARAIGPGMISEDVSEQIPAEMRKILGWKPEAAKDIFHSHSIS